MRTVAYRIVLEGVAPDANEARVRSFLERVRGADGLADNLLENFPTELPGSFDFRRASEWLEALARAGIRGRVDVVTEADDVASGDTAAAAPPAVAMALPQGPWALWLGMWTRPTEVFAALKNGVPSSALWFGVLIAAFGSILALPGEVAVMRGAAGLETRGPWALWIGTVIVEPLLGIALWTVLTMLLLRLIRVPARWSTTLGIVALAQVAAPLAALPVGGSAVAAVATLWFLGVGCATVYELGAAKVAGLYLVPAALALVPLLVFGNLLALVLAQMDPAGILQNVTWSWPR